MADATLSFNYAIISSIDLALPSMYLQSFSYRILFTKGMNTGTKLDLSRVVVNNKIKWTHMDLTIMKLIN